MKYTVYFEFFGKKMKTDVEAPSEREACRKIIERINIVKVEPKEEEDPGFIKFFNDVMSGRK
jgi:hypothetical protein